MDPLPDSVPAGVLPPALQLLGSYVRAVCLVHEVEEDGRSQSTRECYEQTARWLERASSWSGGHMVDVRFERLAEFGGYERRKTPPRKTSLLFNDNVSASARDDPLAVDRMTDN